MGSMGLAFAFVIFDKRSISPPLGASDDEQRRVRVPRPHPVARWEATKRCACRNQSLCANLIVEIGHLPSWPLIEIRMPCSASMSLPGTQPSATAARWKFETKRRNPRYERSQPNRFPLKSSTELPFASSAKVQFAADQTRGCRMRYAV